MRLGFHGVQLLGIGLIGFGIAGAVTGSGNFAAVIGLFLTVVGIGADPAVDDLIERSRKTYPRA